MMKKRMDDCAIRRYCFDNKHVEQNNVKKVQSIIN